MTDVVLQAIRAHYAALYALYPDRCAAREMALQPHRLNTLGTLATLPDGRRFIWVAAADLWMAYRD
jgi:hypothetical protein